MHRSVPGFEWLPAKRRYIVRYAGDEGYKLRHNLANDDAAQLESRENDLASAATFHVHRAIKLAPQRIDVSELSMQESLQAISVSVEQRETPPFEKLANLRLDM